MKLISEWSKFNSLHNYKSIFQHSYCLVTLYSPFHSGLFLIQLCKATSTLALDEKCWPFIASFNFGNNQKSVGAKLGLDRRCSTTVNFTFLIACIVIWPCIVMKQKSSRFRLSWFWLAHNLLIPKILSLISMLYVI